MRRPLAQGQYLIAGDCWDSELEGSSDSNTSCQRCGQPGAVSVVEEIYSLFAGEVPVMASFCPDLRPLSLWLLVFQGLSGLYGGGALLHLPLDLLEGFPFTELRIPGLILLTVLGVGPLVVAAGLWRRRIWARHGAVAISGALIIWIAVEAWIIDYHAKPPLQLIYGILGVLLLISAVRPCVRRAILHS